MASYKTGQQVTLSWEYRTSPNAVPANQLYDPAVPKFSFKPVGGVITTYTYPADAELVRDATGKYHLIFDTTALVGTVYLAPWADGADGTMADDWSIQVAPNPALI